MLIPNYENAIELLQLIENELDVLSDDSSLGHDVEDEDDNIPEGVKAYIKFVENAAAELQGLVFEFLSSYSIQKG